MKILMAVIEFASSKIHQLDNVNESVENNYFKMGVTVTLKLSSIQQNI